MPSTQPLRKSGRSRVPSTKYQQVLRGPEFGDSSGDDVADDQVEATTEQVDHDDDGDDEEFQVDQTVAEAEAEEDDDDVDEEHEPSTASSGDEIASGQDEHEDDGSVVENERPAVAPQRARIGMRGNAKGNMWRWVPPTQPEENHIRGLTSRLTKANRARLITEAFGKDGFKAAAAAVRRWTDDITLPTRTNKMNVGGFAYPIGFEHGLEADQPSVAKPYFTSLEQISIPRVARKSIVGRQQQAEYLPATKFPLKLLAGPYNAQVEHYLQPQQAMDLSTVLGEHHADGSSVTNGDRDKATRNGWVINAGGRVLSMSWAPARTGSAQYLAVAVEQKDTSSGASTPFAPSKPYPASIQIWRFPSSDENASIDSSQARASGPKLVKAICAKWGGARKVLWCPVLPNKGTSGPASVGLLATIWMDGHVRVLDVEEASNDKDTFQLYTSAPFAAKPPDSVCTCLEWIGSGELAAGCANGFLAVWNIASALARERLDASSVRPYFYHSLSDSYIIAMVSAAPNAPHLIQTISVTGYQQLTDMRNPVVETVHAHRGRLYQTSTSYSCHLQSFITADETGDLIALTTRRFFNSKRIAPTSVGYNGGTVVATSPCHCSVIFGSPDGQVCATNPVRRFIDAKRLPAYTQRWFVHEWRPPGNDRGEDGSLSGVVRMTEGYKVTEVEKMKRDVVVQAVAVFEEQQAITAIVWNPNIDCGGWAAAGTGSGLIRVEDVAVEHKVKR